MDWPSNRCLHGPVTSNELLLSGRLLALGVGSDTVYLGE